MQYLEKYIDLTPFIKDIMLLENPSASGETILPFYADGFPGIVFTETINPVYLNPGAKKLSTFFLYGQTIHPIELFVHGPYKILAFQLYPFASKLLLGVNPKVLNDDCFDLLSLENIDTETAVRKLNQSDTITAQVAIISNFIKELVKASAGNPDYQMKLAINLILKSKGSISIKELREKLYISERTFERRFAQEVGVSPKQFAKIIQFSFSMNRLKEADYSTLTELSYDGGFSDQSHFIKTFKRYVGKTPKEFLKVI